MPTFRVERTGNYTVMSNHHLRNEKLSLKAKGLLSQMLSLQRTILVEAANILTDAWAGMPVENLPSVSRLQIAAHNAKQLRDLPLPSGKGGD